MSQITDYGLRIDGFLVNYTLKEIISQFKNPTIRNNPLIRQSRKDKPPQNLSSSAKSFGGLIFAG